MKLASSSGFSPSSSLSRGRWLKDGWVGAPPHFIAHTCRAPELPFFVFFCETSASPWEGCYRRVLIWGILVSRHIVGASRTLSRSRRRPCLRWWKALQSALSRYKVKPNWDTMRFNECCKDFHLLYAIQCSVLVPVIHTTKSETALRVCPSVLTEKAGFCGRRLPRRLVRCRHAGQGDGREFEITSSSCVILFLKLVLCCSPRRLVCDLVERR